MRCSWFGCWLLTITVVVAQQPPEDLQQIAAEFSAHAITIDGHRYPYRLLEPPPPQLEQVPVVLFLHGAGERGDDNVSQLRWLPERMVEPELRSRLPCYLIAVQCPQGERWVDAPWGDVRSQRMHDQPTRALLAAQLALQEVLRRDDVDPARIYVTGLSMGGYGCWELLARDPDRFAAGMPICGGADTDTVPRLCGLPIRFWHGDADRAVPVARSRAVAAQLREYGMPANYHELAGVGHASWKTAYGPDGGLMWLFEQDQRQQLRGAFAELPVVPRLRRVALRDGSFRLRDNVRCHAPESLRGVVAHLFASLAAKGATLSPRTEDREPGDLVLVLDPDGEGTHIDIDAWVTIEAADERSLRHGLVALQQALAARAGDVLPRGRYQVPSLAELTVAIEGSKESWSKAALDRLLHRCWLAGVDRLWFAEGAAARSVAEADVWRAFVQAAERLGIRVLSEAPEDPVQRRVRTSDSIAELLAAPIANEPMHLALVDDRVEGMLRLVATRLPAVRERGACAGRTLHVGSFLSRLGRRWR